MSSNMCPHNWDVGTESGGLRVASNRDLLDRHEIVGDSKGRYRRSDLPGANSHMSVSSDLPGSKDGKDTQVRKWRVIFLVPVA